MTIIFCLICVICSCIKDIRRIESESALSVGRYPRPPSSLYLRGTGTNSENEHVLAVLPVKAEMASQVICDEYTVVGMNGHYNCREYQ